MKKTHKEMAVSADCLRLNEMVIYKNTSTLFIFFIFFYIYAT